jgi:hypothetical protein
MRIWPARVEHLIYIQIGGGGAHVVSWMECGEQIGDNHL